MQRVSSMTGFGRAEYRIEDSALLIEIRTVNHRYSDIFIKTSKHLSFLEDKIRHAIKSRISRGRIDVYISYNIGELHEPDVKLNHQLARHYNDALENLKRSLGYKGGIPLSLIAAFPEVITVNQGEIDEKALWQKLSHVLEQALDLLIDMRRQEGETLKENILLKLKTIDKEVSEIEKRAGFIVDEYRERLEKRLEELAQGISLDSDRIYQEVLIFADRSNIDEELVRLKSHISQMRHIFGLGGVMGRKLDFLAQEMFRETNTIGSKANDLHISRAVIEIKSQLEQIREQIQNIE